MYNYVQCVHVYISVCVSSMIISCYIKLSHKTVEIATLRIQSHGFMYVACSYIANVHQLSRKYAWRAKQY